GASLAGRDAGLKCSAGDRDCCEPGDTSCEGEPPPPPPPPAVIVPLSLGIKNKAAVTRDCLLHFTRGGVKTTLFSGTLAAGEERMFNNITTGEAPYYVDTAGGCRVVGGEFGSGLRTMGVTGQDSSEHPTSR